MTTSNLNNNTRNFPTYASPYRGANTDTNNKFKNDKRNQIKFTKGMFRKRFYRDLVYLNLKRHCYIFIKHTVNNTFMTVKSRGKVILTKSSGSVGFKGPKRSGVYAAIELAKHVRETIKKTKKTATVYILSKVSNNIKSAIKNLSYNRGIKILDIVQRIPVSHNGLRKSHVRRK